MKEPLTSYQRRLFVFLSVATFFEGYDFVALSQILPNLRAQLHLSRTAAGLLVAVINVGTLVAYVLVQRADRWGRRRVLSLTIAGYTLFTFLTGLAPNVYFFAACQLAARVFLIGEWVVSMVYAAEEFPAERRGTVIGVIQACSSLGSVVCAGVTPVLLRTHYGWRSVYFAGIVPLVLLSFARRNLRESRRFEESQSVSVSESGTGSRHRQRSLFAVMRTPYRTRIFILGAAWFFTYTCTQTGITFWKEFAVGERHMSDAAVGLAITVAALASMPLVFYAGRLLDRIGRKGGAVVIFGLGALGIVGAYTLSGRWPLTAALALAIFGVSAVLPVLNAFSTELFPTAFRADAFAWSNNLLGRIGYILAPLAVGAAADSVGWGPAVASTAVGLVLALGVILAGLPETRGRELEDTARLGH